MRTVSKYKYQGSRPRIRPDCMYIVRNIALGSTINADNQLNSSRTYRCCGSKGTDITEKATCAALID